MVCYARASVCTLLLHAPGLVSGVRQHASCQPCAQLFGSCLRLAVLKNNLSLLEGLEFTPPSSARTKGDDSRYYVYTYLVRIPAFFFIFRLMRYTDLCFFSLLPDTYVQHLPLYRYVYSLVGGGTHDTYVPPVDAQV